MEEKEKQKDACTVERQNRRLEGSEEQLDMSSQ